MTVTRFAPSPTGRLHLGHAYSALFAERAAREAGGRFLLRIEDIDHTRCQEEFVAGIQEDVEWLGLRSDGEIVRQSERLSLYADALGRLRDAGLVYPCFCTRKDIEREVAAAGGAPHGPAGSLYPGICRRMNLEQRAEFLAAGRECAWRLDTEAAIAAVGRPGWTDVTRGAFEVDPGQFGDVVLARKDIGTSYHLAVTVDDADQGVTLVTRGDDLLESTHVHRLLQALLDLPVPNWSHHDLIAGPDGRRFAKRDGSVTLEAIRKSGKDAVEVRRDLGF